MDPLRPATISKEMENENAMSSVRRCAFIRIETLEFLQHFESTSEIVVTMSMENRRSKKLISQRFSANNGEPCVLEINGEFQLFYSHNVKNHRDPILRFAVENTRAKTFTRHRSIAAALVSMQHVVQHDFDGSLILYESHVNEKNAIGRIRVFIRSLYVDEEEDDGVESENDQEENDQEELLNNNDVLFLIICVILIRRVLTERMTINSLESAVLSAITLLLREPVMPPIHSVICPLSI